jgi:hypothetical protein
VAKRVPDTFPDPKCEALLDSRSLSIALHCGYVRRTDNQAQQLNGTMANYGEKGAPQLQEAYVVADGHSQHPPCNPQYDQQQQQQQQHQQHAAPGQYQPQPQYAPGPPQSNGQQVVYVVQQQYRTEKYCGPITWLIGIFLFPCVCCCPCDERQVPIPINAVPGVVYQSPNGVVHQQPR